MRTPINRVIVNACIVLTAAAVNMWGQGVNRQPGTGEVPPDDDQEVFVAFLRYNHNYLADAQALPQERQRVVQEQIRKTIGISPEGYPKLEATYLELIKKLDAIDTRGRSHVMAALANGAVPDDRVLATLTSERLAAIKAERQELDASLAVRDRTAMKAYIEGEFRTHVRRYKLQ